MEWYKFDIAAFDRATQELTPTECGIYLRLLNEYYRRQGPFPAENGTRRLRLVTGCVSKRDMEALKTILARYFPCASDGLLHNTRADQELEEYQGRVDAARIAARTRHAPAGALPKERYIRKKESACGALIENGQTCTNPPAFWTTHGKPNGCKEHGPF